MNSGTMRKLATEGGMGLAMCVGLLLGVVEPIERRTQALREAAASVERQDSASQAESPEAARRALANAMAEAAEIEHTSVPARSQSELLAAVLRLADEQGVRVEQIEPTAVVGRTAAMPAPAPPPMGGGGTPGPGVAGGPPAPTIPPKPDVVLGCSLAVAGDFASLVAFVDELERSAGYARVRTLRLAAPSEPGSRTVVASVLSEHVAFDVRPVLAAAGKDGTE